MRGNVSLIISAVAVMSWFLVKHIGETRARAAREQAEVLALAMDMQSSQREGVAGDALRELARTTRGLDALPEEERSRQLSAAIGEAFEKAWKQRLTNECANSSVRLVGLVQPLHPALGRLEQVRVRGEIPAALPVPSVLVVRGLPVVFAEGHAEGRLCTDMDPSVAAIVQAEKVPVSNEEITPGVWNIETKDGTAAGALLNPDALPVPAKKLIAFVPTADRVVLALASKPDAVLFAASLAGDADSHPTRKFRPLSEEPLVYNRGAWRPWKPTDAIRSAPEFDAFIGFARICVESALDYSAGRLRIQRSEQPDNLPEFKGLWHGRKGLRISLSEEEPVLVRQTDRVRVTRTDDEELHVSWEQLQAAAGSRLKPAMLDGVPLHEIFRLEPGLSDAEFPLTPCGERKENGPDQRASGRKGEQPREL